METMPVPVRLDHGHVQESSGTIRSQDPQGADPEGEGDRGCPDEDQGRGESQEGR